MPDRETTALRQTATEQKQQRAKDYGPDHGRRNSQRQSRFASEKTGRSIELDDPLCEVETDKAVYPIESSFAGTMGEWKTKVGDTVEIGQELGTILTSKASSATIKSKQPQNFADAAIRRSWPQRLGVPTRDAGRRQRTPAANRACAFADDHARAWPRRAGEPANRRALGCDSQGARCSEERKMARTRRRRR